MILLFIVQIFAIIVDRYLLLYFLLSAAITIFGCAHSFKGKADVSAIATSYNTLMAEYSNDYFMGVGYGNGNSRQMAIKIAKIQAQAELAENIKVIILSKAESITTETKIGDDTTSSDSFKQKIISLGNATVRSPEYEILNVHESKDGFKAQVLVKKLKRIHIEEAARDLEFLDADKLLDILE